MHPNVIAVTETAIRQALLQTEPNLASLPIAPLALGGTETRLYRLGEEYLFRIPLLAEHAESFRQETRWLRWLAPHVPVALPEIMAEGEVSTDPPLPWTIRKWIDGTDAMHAPPSALTDLAERLADFILALRAAPSPDELPQSSRGGPLAPQDAAFDAALDDAARKGLTALDHARHVWQAGLAAPASQAVPVWIHGDLVPGNLILRDGKLVGVIDWSFVTLGDPAYDLIPAWFVLDRAARDRFLDRLNPDPAMIARARARVAWQSVLALPYYLDSNPDMVRLANRGLAAIESDGF